MSSESSPQPRELLFEVDAGLLLELGERLVARNSVALAELIKNAYDADATKVTITFKDVSKPGGSIIIDDNGCGMTLEQVQGSWMRIATQHKCRSPLSPRLGRVTTGEKGVGRFAARRLAERLVLETTARLDDGGSELTRVDFDWNSYQRGRDLASVVAPCWSDRSRESLPTGTKLSLLGTREVWSERDFQDLQKDLLDLTPPFVSGGPGASDFSFSFIAPEFRDFEGRPSDIFLRAAWGRLSAEVDGQGIPHYELGIRGDDKTARFTPEGVQYPGLKNVRLEIYHFVYKSSYFQDVGPDLDLARARTLGRRFGGVRIYLDGFRVFPYGEAGDDWLGLDKERAGRLYATPPILEGLLGGRGERAFLNLPGNNMLFGKVFLSRLDHPGVWPTLTRERLAESRGLDDLREFVRTGIYWITVVRFNQEVQARRGRAKGSEESIASSLGRLHAEIASLTGSDERQRLTEALAQVRSAVHVLEEEQLTKMAVLRILASAGTMMSVFSHEVRALIDGFREVLHDLAQLAQPSDLSRLPEIRGRLEGWTNVVEAQANQIGLLISRDARRRRRRLVLRPVIEQVISSLSRYSDVHGVSLGMRVPFAVRTPPMFEAEVHSVLLNLMTNALKAVRYEPTRRIEVEADNSPAGDLRIWVKDTGHGVAPEDRERVFQPFVTSSVSDPILGVGTGIGLSIVRDIVEEHQGQVHFVEAASPWNTCVEVHIPRGLEEGGRQ